MTEAIERDGQVIGVACPACQAPLPADASRCPRCGHDHRHRCPRCAQPSPLGSRFCPHCGAPLTSAGPAAAPDATAQILRNERRLVTVLFADLVDSTGLGDAIDPETYHETITALFRRVATVLRGFGAYVEKYVGDSVMAVFGAPIAREDDAERAIRAGRALHDLVAEIGPEWVDRLGRRPNLRVGVNTGEAIAGRVGEGRAMDYGVLGDVVNLAARLQQAASAGEIVVGEVTAKLATASFTFVELPPLAVKGKPRPIRAYRVHGERRDWADEPVVLVGRTPEQEVLDAALAAVVGGEVVSLAVVGESGAGKTALVRATRNRAREDHARWIWLKVPGPVRDQPFGALRGLVRDLGREATSPDASGGVPAETLAIPARAVPVASEELTLAVLDDVGELGGGFASRLAALEPAVRRQLSVEILTSVLDASFDSPTVLVVDGGHRLDPLSAEVVGHLVERRRAGAVVGQRVAGFGCIVTSRPDWHPPWPCDAVLQLNPLDRRAAQELLGAIVGPEVASGDLTERLWRTTGGNPRFLAELARAAAERGAGATLAMPPTIHALLLARLDELDEVSRRVARVAAVVGETFDLAAVRAALGPEGEVDLVAAIARLEAGDVVGRRPDSGGFGFRLPLFAEVARGTLLQQERSDLHRRLGAWLELTDPTNLGSLAHHFGLGPDDERASHYLQRLGDRQWMLGETEAALRSYQAALARLERLPSAGASARVSLRHSIARALAGLGFPAEALETLEHARPLAPPGPARADVIRRAAEIWSAAGDVDEALGVLARAENELTSLPQVEAVADTLVALAALHATAATILDRAERWADVCRAGEQALEVLTLASRPIPTPSEGPIVLGVHLAIGRALIALGELSRAAEHVQAARALAGDLGDLAAEVRARVLAGHLRSYHGELTAAREDYAEARALARRIGDRKGEALACQYLGELAAAFDDVREAAALYRLARQIYAETGDAREASRCDQRAAALPAAVAEAPECA